MAWKGRTPNDVDFNQLLSTLNNSRVQQSNNALYQTLYQIITNVQQFRDRTITRLVELADNILDIGNTIINIVAGLKDATFWTKDNQTLNFPSSIKVVAGTGITLDYTVANQVTIISSGGGSGVLPMIIADEPPIFMSTGGGDLMIVPFDIPTEIP
jgi:hypothetical protein